MRSRKKAPMLPPLYRRSSPCTGRLPAIMLILTRYGPVAVRPSARPVTVRPALPHHDLECDALAPSTAGFRSRSTTWPVPGDDRGPIEVAHSGGCPACRGGASKAIPAGQNQAKAPPRMRWRGPCPASPHRLASCPALLAQRATRRGQVPVQGTGLPAPPTFPGSRPGDARFRTVRTFLLPERAPRKSPRPSHFRFFRYPRRNPRKRVVMRI